MSEKIYRLGCDIGGTFTDVVLEHDGGQERLKLLTTPAAPESAVLEGIDTILQRSGVKASDV
ncbi:MAG: hypothetical protein HN366_23355, partial [Deltaproteobacteria bacterium]|nr:hypothetical protein [Deltaproteobacteria bacterium]